MIDSLVQYFLLTVSWCKQSTFEIESCFAIKDLTFLEIAPDVFLQQSCLTAKGATYSEKVPHGQEIHEKEYAHELNMTSRSNWQKWVCRALGS